MLFHKSWVGVRYRGETNSTLTLVLGGGAWMGENYSYNKEFKTKLFIFWTCSGCLYAVCIIEGFHYSADAESKHLS